jgi:hypothetical protein
MRYERALYELDYSIGFLSLSSEIPIKYKKAFKDVAEMVDR